MYFSTRGFDSQVEINSPKPAQETCEGNHQRPADLHLEEHGIRPFLVPLSPVVWPVSAGKKTQGRSQSRDPTGEGVTRGGTDE